MNSMGMRRYDVGTQADAHSVQDIFERLSVGVNDQHWRQQVDILRIRGYGVFDLRIAGSGDVEIISPDCQNWWQIRVDDDGCWRLH